VLNPNQPTRPEDIVPVGEHFIVFVDWLEGDWLAAAINDIPPEMFLCSRN